VARFPEPLSEFLIFFRKTTRMLHLLIAGGLGFLGFRFYKKHHPKGHVVTLNVTKDGPMDCTTCVKPGGNFQVAIDESLGIWALPPITVHTDNITFAPQVTPKTPVIGQWAGGAPASFDINWIPKGGTTASKTTICIAK
jgi:hypothetical protein